MLPYFRQINFCKANERVRYVTGLFSFHLGFTFYYPASYLTLSFKLFVTNKILHSFSILAIGGKMSLEILSMIFIKLLYKRMRKNY